MKKNLKRKILWVGILIFLFNFIFRIYFAVQIKGVSGGDAYNNLFIAKYISQLSNPFEGARRLPFYPLLLVPTQFFDVDPIMYSRVVSSSAGAFMATAIYLFSLASGLGIFTSFIVGMITGLSPSSLYISLRPLSNSTFAFLAILSIYLFTREYKFKKYTPSIALPIVLGLMSMTRHEGFIISAIILVFLFFKSVKDAAFKKFVIFMVPYVLLVLPFFVNNVFNFGKLLYSDYLEYPEGLWMPGNISDANRNLGMIAKILPELWFSGSTLTRLGKWLTALSVLGMYIFYKKNGKQSVPLFIVIVSQVLISYWYQPTIRYWLQITPFVVFFTVFGLNDLFTKKVKASAVLTFILVILFVLSLRSTTNYIRGTVRDLNDRTKEEYLLRQALADVLKFQEGKIGLAADYPQAVYFLGEKGVYYTTRPPKNDPLVIQKKWIENNQIRYLIITEEHDFLDIVRSENFKVVKEYKDGGSWVKIYDVTQR